MNYLRIARKVKQELREHAVMPAPESVNPLDGPIIAVLIDSPEVGPVWFALRDDFKSGDDIPVFFMSEIPHLEKMEPAELRRRYEQKIALSGAWIRERHEPTKH